MRQKTLFVAAAVAEAKAAAQDLRPNGWTEANALIFIAEYQTPAPEEFADAFMLGNWPKIRLHWPEFDVFVKRRP